MAGLMFDDDNLDDVPNAAPDAYRDKKHPCSKLFVRIVAVTTCLYMIFFRRVHPIEDDLVRCRTFSFALTCPPNPELENFADPDARDVINFTIRWIMFGSFPILSLCGMIISALILKRWPRFIESITVSVNMMHVFCLFSLFYLFLESLFRSFASMYGVSNADGRSTAPWSEYLLSSMHTLLLWFFFINFLVNMQLTEYDCRTAREIAGNVAVERNGPPAAQN